MNKVYKIHEKISQEEIVYHILTTGFIPINCNKITKSILTRLCKHNWVQKIIERDLSEHIGIRNTKHIRLSVCTKYKVLIPFKINKIQNFVNTPLKSTTYIVNIDSFVKDSCIIVLTSEYIDEKKLVTQYYFSDSINDCGVFEILDDD